MAARKKTTRKQARKATSKKTGAARKSPAKKRPAATSGVPVDPIRAALARRRQGLIKR